MTSVSTTQHNIKHRLKPNDKIYTPKALVKLHLNEIMNLSFADPIKILDPCAGKGAYYKGFQKKYGFDLEKVGIDFNENEITQGEDFFKEYHLVGEYDMIIGNLPFSLTEQFLKRSAELKPKVISYLMPMYGLTAARQEMMEDYGYKLAKIKQFKWYVCMGMCAFVTWVKKDFEGFYTDGKVDVTYDRTVWYKIDVWAKKKAKQRDRDLKKKWKEEEKRVKKQRALLKRAAKSAASIGKKKHNKKWWCDMQEIFGLVRYEIVNWCPYNEFPGAYPFKCYKVWKDGKYKHKYPQDGRKLWGGKKNMKFWIEQIECIEKDWKKIR